MVSSEKKFHNRKPPNNFDDTRMKTTIVCEEEEEEEEESLPDEDFYKSMNLKIAQKKINITYPHKYGCLLSLTALGLIILFIFIFSKC